MRTPGDGLPHDFAAEFHDSRNAALREGRTDAMRDDDRPSRAEAEGDE